jgi:hypothetical protein
VPNVSARMASTLSAVPVWFISVFGSLSPAGGQGMPFGEARGRLHADHRALVQLL